MRRELFGLGVVVLVLVAFPFTLLAYQSARSSSSAVRTIDVVARMPEAGGFGPDAIRLNRGETVRLRLSSPDVVHGFEIPGLGVSAPDIYPGHVVEVTFTPDKPGRFDFTCTRWCSTTHWRMRGIVEVVDPAGPAAPARVATAEPPLYQQLGIDLDAMPELAPRARESLNRLAERPSAARGEAAGAALPAELRDASWLRAHTPADAFLSLRNDAGYGNLSDAEIWDLVALAWSKQSTDAALARAAALYARDCAACHGEGGRGDGPMAGTVSGLQRMMPEAKRGPADFTNAERMAALSDATLQGKLLRGGMGTGMPPFGSLYSPDDQWALVAFVRNFTMERSDYGKNKQ